MSREEGQWPKKGGWIESAIMGIGGSMGVGGLAFLGGLAVVGGGAAVVPVVAVGAGIGFLAVAGGNRGLAIMEKRQTEALLKQSRETDEKFKRRAEARRKGVDLQAGIVKESSGFGARGKAAARAASSMEDPTFSRLAASERRRGTEVQGEARGRHAARLPKGPER